MSREHPYTPKKDWHFLRSLWQRHNILLSRDEVVGLKKQVKVGTLVVRAKNAVQGRSEYYAPLQGKVVPIVAVPAKGDLVTALPVGDNLVRTTFRRQTSGQEIIRQEKRDGKGKFLRENGKRHKGNGWKDKEKSI